jgi:hypothetical protein
LREGRAGGGVSRGEELTAPLASFLDRTAPLACSTYPRRLISVAGTQLFIRQSADVWTDVERTAFVGFVAANPEEGDVIPGTGGVRTLRWGRQGSGSVAAPGSFIFTTMMRFRFTC